MDAPDEPGPVPARPLVRRAASRSANALRRLQSAILPVLLMLLGLSLGLHIWTLLLLQQTRTLAQQQVGDLAEQVRLVQNDVLTTTLRLSQPLPVRVVVPVQQQINVPVETSVQLDETINVRMSRLSLPVPLQLSLPISMTVPVTIEETITISTTVALDMDVPLSLPVRETSLSPYLDRLHRTLLALNEQLGGP